MNETESARLLNLIRPPGRTAPYQRQPLDFWVREDERTGCLLWQRAHLLSGYGVVRRGKQTLLVHRLTYSEFVGAIPPGEVIHHTCWRQWPDLTYRRCCNWNHLEPRTRRANAREGFSVILNKDTAAQARAELCALAARYGVSPGTLCNLLKPNGNWS